VNNGGDAAAQNSALQALGGIIQDQPARSAQVQQVQQPQVQQAQVQQPQLQQSQASSDQQPAQSAGHVGNWTARTPNGATVQLTLQADGSFTWTANNSGKTNSFQGTYTLGNGSLSLARSTDNQKLAGSITSSASGFNFKLTGAKDSGLNFARG